jgi:2'-5' RNA ligase
MRLFVAINIPAPIRDALHSDVAPLREASGGVRWVASPALHVTLKFLGEQGDAVLDPLRAALSAVASRHQPFAVETTEVGAFPNFRRPRVVWLGMTGEATFRAIARDLDEALAPMGVAPESRPFQAHVTLGRVKAELRPADSVALAKAAAGTRARRGFSVHAVDLMCSELGPGGSRYSVVASAPFHARGT